MTTTVDIKRRVILRQAKPGDRFDVAIPEPGKYVLTKLEPVRSRPARVRLVKRDGYTVGVSNQPVSMEAIRMALHD